MLKEIPTVAQAHSSEPVPLNRQRALKSVNVQSKIRDSFCERYNLLDAENSPLISECNALLDEHFFASAIENKGLVVGNHHRALVMQVSIETGLSPFNNEIYPVITPFGQLKVMATVDGWMRIATSEPITERTYCYSDSSNKVEINGREYEVPQWIECKVVHKDRGISVAREYFEEVFQNAQHHMPSWSRPARMLRHVSFIQALRQLISVNALADSDIIADVTAAYEAKATQAQMEIYSTSDNPTPTPLTNQLTSSTKQTPRALNIDLDNVTIEGDPSVSEVAKETEAESTDEVAVETEAESTDEVAVETEAESTDEVAVETEAESTDEVAVETEAESTDEVAVETEAKSTDEVAEETEAKSTEKAPVEANTESIELIDEVMVNRTVLAIVKPYLIMAQEGRLPLTKLISKRVIIQDQLALKWFDQQVDLLR